MDNNYIKIRTRLIIDPYLDIQKNNHDGTFKPSEYFLEKIFSSEEDLRSMILTQINEIVGLFGWAIIFEQFSLIEPIYIANIYSKNIEDFESIKNVLKERIDAFNLKYVYKGNIELYLNS